MARKKILIVDDDARQRQLYATALDQAGYETLEAGDGEQALALLRQSPASGGPVAAGIALVLCDRLMAPMDGLALLRELQAGNGLANAVPVLMVSGSSGIDEAVAAMRGGAVDFLVKPVSLGKLLAAVARHAGDSPPAARCATPQSPSWVQQAPVAADPVTRDLFDLATSVARQPLATSATVLITGPSGTGKEVVAQHIHQQSPRARAPFVAINCAAIPATMLEAMLFGYERGAFTGALRATAGKFEQAQGGTLLLDEISEMDLDLQAKLLRVLQERQVERIGGNQPIDLDIRIIATSNRDLARAVAAGTLRADLFYRLSVFPLRLPALQARPGDILPLAERTLARLTEGRGRLSEAARQKLLEHTWPGNVRELENVIERAVIIGGPRIEAIHLQFDLIPANGDDQDAQLPVGLRADATPEPGAAGLRATLRSQEQRRILQALSSCVTRRAAAGQLGISERTLRYKIAQLRAAGVAVPRRGAEMAATG